MDANLLERNDNNEALNAKSDFEAAVVSDIVGHQVDSTTEKGLQLIKNVLNGISKSS